MPAPPKPPPIIRKVSCPTIVSPVPRIELWEKEEVSELVGASTTVASISWQEKYSSK